MASRYKALLEERRALVAEGEKIFAVAEKDRRDLTDAEKARDDEIDTELKALDEKIQREERQRERVRNAPAAVDGNVAAQARSMVSGMRDRTADDELYGFGSAAEFGRAVHAASVGGYVDQRLFGAAPDATMRETGSAEGYLVPPAMRDAIWEHVFDDEGIVQLFDPEPTSSNAVTFIADEDAPWGDGGVVARWRAEAQKMEPSKFAQGERTTKLNDLYAFVLATEELLEDAPLLESRITKRAGQAIQWEAGEALLFGDGTGKPLGALKGNGVVTVAKDSGQAAGTITLKNIANMYAAAINPQGAFWLMSAALLPQLIELNMGGNLIWTPPSTGITGAPGGYLLGRPIRYSEHAEAPGSVGDISLLNPQGYHAITKSSGVKFASSIHLFFDYNIRAFRWTFRLGGQPIMSKPLAAAKGGLQRSYAVTLAERA